MHGDKIWDLNSSEATPNNPSPISAVDHHIDYREKKTLNTNYDHENRPSKVGEIKIRGAIQDVEIRHDDRIGNSLVKTNSFLTNDCRQFQPNFVHSDVSCGFQTTFKSHCHIV